MENMENLKAWHKEQVVTQLVRELRTRVLRLTV
jgi:hypothetical protein